ncbi:unnamed protein product [Adineta ricciae]|uniref:STING ligand-binding domain-containing protein n=1 Tax=Adineta ricciae TaxID=249248 RepID=A0A814ETP7_ADIRI|nr:unnamed protein product [Adineta ricciae]CAF1195240.1 unnamed protein product [Adineta ricciae]
MANNQTSGSELSFRNFRQYSPLILHANSIASGLLFNYYYSYLNRQIGSTNNIFIKFIFNEILSRDLFPLTIFVKFHTLIEKSFLEKSPSTVESDGIQSIQSKILQFKFDQISQENSTTIVNYSLIGVNDFGISLQLIRIFQDDFPLDNLNEIQLNDDIREWNYQYIPLFATHSENEHIIKIFEKTDDSTKKCYFLPSIQRSMYEDGNDGVNTMKKTSRDCYNLYRNDPKIKNSKTIKKIKMIPEYFLIMPSSCDFGSPCTADPKESDEIPPEGIIKDRNDEKKIRLAWVNGEVLRSRPMYRYNRYLRRTYYYFDEFDIEGHIIRYLFCGEHPFILSTLHQLTKSEQISSSQKYNEYLRFCSMLNRIIEIESLQNSIKLISFNDYGGIDSINYADYQSLSEQIRREIDQWDEITSDLFSSHFIESMILNSENNSLVLFYSSQMREDPLARRFIEDLKEKLTNENYYVKDANCILNSLTKTDQVIFICDGSENTDFNRLIIEYVENKTHQINTFRDVFIFVNNSIERFSCRLLQTIPFITFDFSPIKFQLNNAEFDELLYYIKNMNILSRNYADDFQDVNRSLDERPLQCTSVGEGCAAAFYFNYLKLLSPLPDHRSRVESIKKDFDEEIVHKDRCKFISKWVFVLPWAIKDTLKIFPNAMSLTEDERNIIGFELKIWKQSKLNLTVTVGGIYQRSYSPLTIYRLTRLDTGETFYFPMEIPAALHGLQNQYNNLLSHFHFGTFDSLEQAMKFQEKVKAFFENDPEKIWQKNILIVPLEKPREIRDSDHFQLTRILLKTLWTKLSSAL